MSEQTSGPPCPYPSWEWSGANSMKELQNTLTQAVDVITAPYYLNLGLCPDIQGFIYLPKYASPHQCTSDCFYYSCKSQVTGWRKKKWPTLNDKQVWNWKEGEWMKSLLAQGSVGTVLQVADFFLKRWSVSLWGEEAKKNTGKKVVFMKYKEWQVTIFWHCVLL